MRCSVEVTSLGAGAGVALRRGAEGYVEACFTRATYVRTQWGVAALTAPGTHAGPLHALLAAPLPCSGVGTRVGIDAMSIVVGDIAVAYGAARRWRGACPAPAHLLAGARASVGVIDAVARSSPLLCPPYANATAGWLEALRGGDVEAIARRLGGVGPGLTPAGDDALAGVLLVARILWGVSAEPTLLQSVADARTSELSRAFLFWAARGQSIAPTHDLLSAVARGDIGAVERNARILGGVGASSGADVCLGIGHALRLLPVRSAAESSRQPLPAGPPGCATCGPGRSGNEWHHRAAI
jgi:hypothetical protein